MIRRSIVAPLLFGLFGTIGIACNAYAGPTQLTPEARPPAATASAPAPTKGPVLAPVAEDAPTAVTPTVTPIPTIEPTPTVVAQPTVVPTIEATPTPTPEATKLPEPTIKPVSEPTKPPTPTATPPVVTPSKLFELVCDFCTPEQLKTFSTNAKEDYLKVLEVYGIDEREARVNILVNLGDFGGLGGYSIGFNYAGARGGAAGPATNFTTSRWGMRHELTHAVNFTLLGRDIPSWLDEGLSQYVSGETRDNRGFLLYDREKNLFQAYTREQAFNLLRQNPEEYWKKAVGGSPVHTVGWHAMTLMQERGLDDRIYARVIGRLAETRDYTKSGVKRAFAELLGNVDYEFELLEPGFRKYNPDAL